MSSDDGYHIVWTNENETSFILYAWFRTLPEAEAYLHKEKLRRTDVKDWRPKIWDDDYYWKKWKECQ